MENPFNYFDHIFCINLDERKDRWKGAVEQFKKINIEDRIERFSAIHDKNGRNGCGMSHIEIIKKCKKNNYKTPLIFEDDVLFLESRDITFTNLYNSLEKLNNFDKWSLFYLGGTINKTPKEKSNNLVNTDCIHTTSSYAVHPNTYNYIIDNASKKFYNNWVDKAIDDWLVDEVQNHYAQKNLSYTFVANPLICLQRDSWSDIENRNVKTSDWQMERWNYWVNGKGEHPLKTQKKKIRFSKKLSNWFKKIISQL